MSKPIKNYILLVDNHRRPERCRNTAGRYRVGAKTPEEAIKLLREQIEFGSIQVYYECTNSDLQIPYKTVFKETEHPLNPSKRVLTEPSKATEDSFSQWLKYEAAKLKKSFPETKLLSNGEVVVHIKGNQYFNLATCESHQEVEYKVIEWLSRGAHKTDPYRIRTDLTQKFHKYMLDGINDYLGTAFTEEDMELIYTRLGNGVNRTLTKEFFDNDFDMNVLRPQSMKR